MTEVVYEVCVTPRFDELTPLYDALIYKSVQAGVCGPSSQEFNFASLSDIDAWISDNGFERTGPYGAVCRNGFASAEIKVKGA